MRVLLVEDDDGDADWVAARLRAAAPETESVELARVDRVSLAKERLEGERFDVVLLDLSIPDASGFQGLERLRATAKAAPIVVLTSVEDPTEGTRALQNGAHDYLQKRNAEGSELLRAIRHARERAEHAERARLLAEVSVASRRSADPKAICAAVQTVVAAGFADSCLIDGSDDGKSGTSRAPTTGVRLHASFDSVDEEDRAHIDELRRLGSSSAILARFSVEGWAAGSMIFGRSPASSRFSPDDVALADEITRRVAGALEHCALIRVAERERARAEVASRLRDEFVATLSHELRTPLTAILGWTQLLRSGKVPVERMPKAFEVIERSTRSQMKLVEDVLDVSQIITGKLRLDVSVVDVAETVAVALESVRAAADAKSIALGFENESGEGERACMVQGDRGRLVQILWNLLGNAVKFTPRAGSVTIKLRKSASLVEIVVTDDGEGMAREFIPHVFDRFRQADSTESRVHGGLGVGLAITRHLVEAQGGTVHAESEGANRGSTFVVRLPASPLRAPAKVGEARASERPPASASSLAGLHVLVVDDDVDTRAMLQVLLETAGAKVVCAASVEEAFSAFRRRLPDVLVSDIGMPGATGFDLIHQLRELSSADGGGVPALALTAYARPEDRAKALTLGFDHYLAKPAEPDDLVAAISKLARKVRPSAG